MFDLRNNRTKRLCNCFIIESTNFSSRILEGDPLERKKKKYSIQKKSLKFFFLIINFFLSKDNVKFVASIFVRSLRRIHSFDMEEDHDFDLQNYERFYDPICVGAIVSPDFILSVYGCKCLIDKDKFFQLIISQCPSLDLNHISRDFIRKYVFASAGTYEIMGNLIVN